MSLFNIAKLTGADINKALEANGCIEDIEWELVKFKGESTFNDGPTQYVYSVMWSNVDGQFISQIYLYFNNEGELVAEYCGQAKCLEDFM